MSDTSEVEITKEVEMVRVPKIDDEVEMESCDIFKSDIIIVDDNLLKNTKSAPDRNTKDQQASAEKFGGNIFSRVLKRAQSFGKNKSVNSEDRNHNKYFSMRRKKELIEVPKERKQEWLIKEE